MATTPQFVRTIAPEFSSETDDRINVFIEIADRSIAENIWSDHADYGRGYLAAHLMTISSRGGLAGPVKSEKVGDLSQSFAVSDAATSLDSSSYGKEYLRLRSEIAKTPVVASGDPVTIHNFNRVVIV